MDIEEDIKELKEVLLHYRETEKVRKAIRNLLAEREEDKKRIEQLEVLEDDLKDKRIVYVDTPDFKEKYIPTQKVYDKIDELNEEFDRRNTGEDDNYYILSEQYAFTEEILKELLEVN